MRERQMPELLCPAGSFAALEAAIEGGADAVYMGGTLFNARIHAKNFTPQELERGIALTHSYGVKVYIAANTLIYDREIEDFLRAAEEAYLAGADALIVADVGCAAAVHRRLPIELHASTQLSGHNAEAARRLAACGFSRMVCAREMSREDLAAFTAASPIEAEVFVHGALCVCHSGQCLFSSLVGGRSGNRGECAQPCRLPYGLKNGKRGFPLSLRDLSLAEHLPELARMGVASLKIEGRMKSPEYVRDVAAVFRRLLDE
ncbi:MAG: U32 family peptidase [Clostridia bacterium]|nr:U32 family peptidase [Clostridia bacterium]